MMHYVTKVAFSETSIPRVEFTNGRKTVSVNGKPVHVPKIATWYGSLLARVKVLMAKLTAGFAAVLPFLLSELHDDKLQEVPNYSFLNNRRQDLQMERFKGLTAFFRKPGFVQKQGDEVVWNRQMMVDWMRDAHALNKLLMVLMHIGGGQPARGVLR